MKNPISLVRTALWYFLLYGTAQAQTALPLGYRLSNALAVNTPAPQIDERVAWASFTATVSGSKVLVRWATKVEINTKQFTVQRSVDSLNWENLTTIPAAGNSSISQKYAYDDLNPARGVNYYRIFEEDLGDRNFYSRVVRVDNTFVPHDLTAYPNPATDRLRIDGEPGARIEFLSFSGEVMVQKELTGSDEIDLTQYQRGLYLLRSGDQIVKVVVK